MQTSGRGNTPGQPNVRLSQGGSLLLDVIRFFAAFAVFASHFVVVHGFSLVAFGHQAVWIFFVLSGFVIRFITVTRIDTVLDYSIDRASRIYSVVGPALFFTLICELLARAVHPALYAVVKDPFAWKDVPLQFLANLTFTGQCWGYEVNPLSNSPFWSLNFECIYYAMYALVRYRVRWGWMWVALLLFVAGPSIALLAPVWLLGCFTCDLYLWLSRRPHGVGLGTGLAASLLLLFAAARHAVAHLMQWTEASTRRAWVTRLTGNLPFQKHLLRGGFIPWLDRVGASAYIVGLFTAAVILAGLLLLDRFLPNLPPRLTRYVRLVADSTFVLYLFHLPLLLLIEVLLRRPVRTPALELALLLGIPVVLIPIARWTDELKTWMRRWLRRATARRRQVAST